MKNSKPLPLVVSSSLVAYFAFKSKAEIAENPNVPGDSRSIKSRIMEDGASLLQPKMPVGSLKEHLCGVDFYNGDLKRQVFSHKFCSHLNDDVHQCIIFDKNEPNARLIGVEYLISEKLFKTFPEEEKKLWHSNIYEVKSGQLVAPDVHPAIEEKIMEDMILRYGKTFHFWHIDKDSLPLGIPQLMMTLTRDGQLQGELVDKYERLGLFEDHRMDQRRYIPDVTVEPGADSWTNGEIIQLDIKKK